MTDLTKLEIWIDEDHKTTAAELLADNEGHADVADAVERLASHKDHTIAVGIGAGWTTLSVLPPVHHSLIEGVTKVLNATRELCEAWGQYGASEIMHDAPVNHWYPFNDELGQVVFKMEAWRAVLAREKDCCPCDGCGEVVMSDETHGEGPEWLCSDCYSTWKRCAECKRTMTDDECGDELPEERVCDTCAGIEADAPEEAANPYVGKRCTQCDVEMRTDNKRGMDWSWVCAACAPTLKEWAATMPVGTRVLVTGECFPHWLGKDEPGVVVLDDTDTPGGSVWIRLDRYFEGLSDWDNEVGVTPDDWSHGSAHRVVKVAPQEPTHDTDSCEDAGCPDHGIDAMPERWAEDAGTQ